MPKKDKKKILETDGSDGANDNLFSVPNFQMVVKESQEGYKQPTDSRDSA